jgi:geranylgeranyl diphosphate synthase type II
MIDRRLNSLTRRGSPEDLVDGCRYVLAGGGKRIRSTLVLLSCEAVGGTALRALDAGAAVEIMHNFTLVHDDIMDNAPARRGMPTVHVRWDVNNALLVGDVLIGLAYRTLLKARTNRLPRIVSIFTDGLLTVCEGQALDLEFEHRDDVTVAEYFGMIEKKTASLMAAAAEIGAVIGGGTRAQVSALRSFGQYLGRAFQLQDDLLDVVAEHKQFGKAIGGDIVKRKKTFLLLTAAGRAQGDDRQVLRGLLRPGAGGTRPLTQAGTKALIARVTDIYRRYGVLEDTRKRIMRNTAKAAAALDDIPQRNATAMLRWLSDVLVHRAS